MTYVAVLTIKKQFFHQVFRCKTHLNLFRFVPSILYTSGGIAKVPIDMLEPILSPETRRKQQKPLWEIPPKGESSVATFSYFLSVISYFLCMIQTRRLNDRSWVVPQTYGTTSYVRWYLLPAKKQKSLKICTSPWLRSQFAYSEKSGNLDVLYHHNSLKHKTAF